jgi:predicted esterase
MNRTRRLSFAILAGLILLFSIASARAAQAPQVVDIGQRMLLLVPDGVPRASVILIPGGTTHPTITPDGTIGALSNNFLMRVRDQFVTAGFAVGIVEKPEDLRAAIARMRTVRNPVFVIGHSDGTMWATNAAISLGADGPDGIVLASSVVVAPPSMPRSVLEYPLEQIGIPVLIVRNENDTCKYSPPSGMDAIAKRLVKAQVSTVSMTSSQLEGNPCQNLSPHSYLDIEGPTVAKIVDWLNAHAATSK